MPQPEEAPAWTRVASTAFTQLHNGGGLALSTLAILNYNGLDSRVSARPPRVSSAARIRER